MISNRAVALSYSYATNRGLFYLLYPFKKIRDSVLLKKEIPDLVPEIQQALLSVLHTAYLYGRFAVAGFLNAKKEFRLEKRQFVDWAVASSIINIMIMKDKGLLKLLLSPVLFKRMSNEVEAFAEYFAPSENTLNFFKNYSLDLAQVQGENINLYANTLISYTLKSGMGEDEAAKYIKKHLETLTNGRAKAIARTEATRGFNVGTLQESLDSEIVEGYRFSAVLDNSTTQICKQRDGLFISKEDIESIARNTPPLHVNCRSRLEAVTIFDKRERKLMSSTMLPESQQRPSDVEAVKSAILGR